VPGSDLKQLRNSAAATLIQIDGGPPPRIEPDQCAITQRGYRSIGYETMLPALKPRLRTARSRLRLVICQAESLPDG
jgi:hypothetical protein